LQRRHHGSSRLRENLGDGFLYAKNPVFRRIRRQALRRGFTYSLRDPDAYFGFPLIALETVLRTRVIPYRDNFRPLLRLEQTRRDFYALSDLRLNRPTPNYVLHESAHAIAFDELFGHPSNTRAALSEPSRLVSVMLGEAFAMCAEYFAACCVSGHVHGWFFSINSYRRRTPARKAVGELVGELGFEAVAWSVLGAFLYNNFLVDRLSRRQLEGLLAAHPLASNAARTKPPVRQKLRRALSSLMVMSPEFRLDTSRLFLTMLGYPRDIRRVLRADPVALLEREGVLESAGELVTTLARGA